MKISLVSAGVAALLTIAAMLLGQSASDLRVPGARYVAAASTGFDALANAGTKPSDHPTPAVAPAPSPADGAVPVDAPPAPVVAPNRSKV